MYIESVPLYLLEVVPYANHGKFNILYYFCISIGIYMGTISQVETSDIGEGWVLGVCTLLVVIFCTLLFSSLVDIPVPLVNRGKIDDGKTEVELIGGVKDVDIELLDILSAAEASQQQKVLVDSEWSKLLRKQYRPQLHLDLESSLHAS
ncbi:hypothetical protein ACH5RR_011687 [Cinchona calisaya]|uniref:Uncharacterized protein n=1 Tax=Cinchona calisaya TaxID=153742 RepID=A0ABD3A5L6_9GENT